MSKPSNWFSMDYAEQREWKRNQDALENAEYEARRAQEDAESARREVEQARRNYREHSAGYEEEIYYMSNDMEAKNNRINELEALLKQVPSLLHRGLQFVYAHVPPPTEHQLAVDMDSLRIKIEDALEPVVTEDAAEDPDA